MAVKDIPAVGGISIGRVKNALNINWGDPEGEKRLFEVMQEADGYLRNFTGADFIEWDSEPQYRALFYDCVRYIRAAALPDFTRNYDKELNEFHDSFIIRGLGDGVQE